VLTATAEQLARNAVDLPFSAVYLVDDDGTARLGSAVGIDAGSPAVPTS
jgi:hypothetical protein